MRSTALLVGNPTAQSGQNARRITRAAELLDARGLACTTFATLPDGATIGALRDALIASPPDVVIAMGGDGTFREVGCALMASGHANAVAMGMLPTGTANDQGRSFGLASGDDALERNVAVIADGHETRLDAVHLTRVGAHGEELGRCTFFDSAGWGLSARVLLERNVDRAVVEKLGPLRALYRDQLVYAGAFARVFVDTFVRDHTFDATVDVDGVVHELSDLTDLIVKNTRIYAGAWIPDRTSRADDGLVEIVPFRDQADWIAKAIIDHEGNPLPDPLRDPLGNARAEVLRGRRIAFTFRAPVLPLAQIDGEEADPSPSARVEVEPRAIRLLVPEAHA
ncbi:MAG: diacylglycerol kinase family protein [Polyangiaceae bacterium]